MTAPIITGWNNLHDPAGTQQAIDWPELFARFEQAGEYRGPDKHAGWTPAEFVPCKRAAENVRRVFAVVLDYDGSEPIGGARKLWSRWFGLLHTTRRHTADLHRFRVVLPLARAVSPFEYSELWKRIALHAGGRVDPAPKDPSRFWFTPARGEHEYHCETWDGPALDPDEWLARPLPEQRREHQPASSVEERAIRYIAKMPEAISGSGGHQAAWKVALVLARGFDLGERTTLSILQAHYNPRCEPRWSDRELEHKSKQAAASDRLPRGFLLKDEHDWEPQRFEVPEEPRERKQEPRGDAPRLLTYREILAECGSRALSNERVDVITTGHYKLDEVTGGLRPGFVWVVGADTSWGKSSFLVSVADENIKRGKQVLIVSGEDDETLYGDRLLVRRAGIDFRRYSRRMLNRDEQRRVTAVMSQGEAQPVYLDGRGRSIERVCGHIERVCAEHSIDVVALDYVQAFDNDKKQQDKRNQITYIARRFTDTVKRLGKSGVIFSQITQQQGKTTPDKHSIRDSRDVSNAAEVVLLGFEPDKPVQKSDGTTLAVAGQKVMKLDKCKNGPRGGIYVMDWDSTSACFRRVCDPDLERYREFGEQFDAAQ